MNKIFLKRGISDITVVIPKNPAPVEKTAENPVPLRFYLLQNDEKVKTFTLFKEDLPRDGYGIFKVGSLENIKTTYDTLFVPYEIGVFTINLSGLSTV